MQKKITIRNYKSEDAQALAHIYYHTIHQINTQHYTQEQVDAWAPLSTLEADHWIEKFAKTKPIIAMVENEIVGFAELELNGHIDCFYCHHNWIGKGVGSVLMKEIFQRAKKHQIPSLFANVSITAKPFFEKHGFHIVEEQTISKRGIQLKNFKMEKTFS